MNNRFVILVGNVGSGKSTLTDLLAEQLPAERVPADSLYTVNPFFPLAVEDRRRWSLTSDLWFLRERVRMTRGIPDTLKKSHVVVDSGLPMSYVYAHSRIKSGYMTADEWQLYQGYHDDQISNLRQPDLLIYLEGSVQFLRRRIEERGREFEVTFHTPEYLDCLNESLEALMMTAQRANMNVIRIDAEKVDFLHQPEEVTGLISKILAK